jgi:hypothetical protein
MFVFASSRLAAYLSFAPSAAQVFDDDGSVQRFGSADALADAD